MVVEKSIEHPKLTRSISTLRDIAANPVGILGDYPVMGAVNNALIAMLEVMPSKLGFNLWRGPAVILDKLEEEQRELDETRAIEDGELNNKVLKELIDCFWFGAMVINLYELGYGVSHADLTHVHAMIAELSKLGEDVPFEVMQAQIKQVEETNKTNYPPAGYGAKEDWNIALMAHHAEQMDYRLKELRHLLTPDRVLPEVVHQAITTFSPQLPAPFNEINGAQNRFAQVHLLMMALYE